MNIQPIHKYISHIDAPIPEALQKLNELASDAILFLIDDNKQLVGSLTDGDLRRGFIKGLGFKDHISQFMQLNPKYIEQGNNNIKEILALRDQFINVFPVLNGHKQIINVVNLRHQKSYLPVDALIMAGGRGERLKPLTDITPKPLLKVGEKPIIEHNIDRLNTYGIDDVWISVRYLGQQLVDYFQDGSKKSIRIKYIWEENALGTAGSLAFLEGLNHDHILMLNSDLLTNIDFEDLYLFFEHHQADFVVACIPYNVNVPYAVMETRDKKVIGFKEKPTYTYYSNAGIYLMKKEVIDLIPKNQAYNATDLMEQLIQQGKNVVAYPLLGYWLDIGNHRDFNKAQIDIKEIKF
jgi:dTDP-glucose pyrophosphorylase